MMSSLAMGSSIPELPAATRDDDAGHHTIGGRRAGRSNAAIAGDSARGLALFNLTYTGYDITRGRGTNQKTIAMA